MRATVLGIVAAVAVLPAAAQTVGPVLTGNVGPVVAADEGWVQAIYAGPVCDGFAMQPSGRGWVIQRGTPMHDGVMAAANANYIAWLFYRLNPAIFHNQPPMVVVSASTSPAPPGSSHPGYDQVPIYQPSQAVCGDARVSDGYTHMEDSAIAILPASGY